MQRRLIIRQVWAWLGADKRLIEIGVALVATYLIILILPQSPVPSNDHTAFSLWLAELYPVFGAWRNFLATLGLLTMRTSLWMRVWIAALSLIFAVRLSELIENWGALSIRSRGWKSLVVLGVLLFVAGWGTQTLYAWTELNVVAWPETPVPIPNRSLTVPPLQTKLRLWNGYWGLYLLPQGTSWGFEVQASDLNETPLLLLPLVENEPRTHLNIALTSQKQEAYFALPEQNLIFQISVPQTSEPDNIQFQALNMDGELLIESLLGTEQTQQIEVEDIRLQMTRLMLPRFEAIYNPGALLQIMGGLAVLIGFGLRYVVAREIPLPLPKSPDADTLLPEEDRRGLLPVEDEGETCNPSSLV
ncbi:MAG: hypothetical protein JXA21_25895 [Anaerolineae bacterium]|nr:hypothetical protein [Anaerolineae bacterium]